jgi:hypothetical protein
LCHFSGMKAESSTRPNCPAVDGQPSQASTSQKFRPDASSRFAVCESAATVNTLNRNHAVESEVAERVAATPRRRSQPPNQTVRLVFRATRASRPRSATRRRSYPLR